MKDKARLVLCTLAAIALGAALHADNKSVFSFKGSTALETIEGILVLNRDAARTPTAGGFSFASPVEALQYTVTDASGVIDQFTFSTVNPNTLTITKGAGGSTSFELTVAPEPTDPPSGVLFVFGMSFTFPGAAPWGDWIPDRTILGAQNVSLAAGDLYDSSVSILELHSELAAIQAALDAFGAKLAADYKNPAFQLPGATPSDRVVAILMALEKMSTGQRKQLYNYLNAAP